MSNDRLLCVYLFVFFYFRPRWHFNPQRPAVSLRKWDNQLLMPLFLLFLFVCHLVFNGYFSWRAAEELRGCGFSCFSDSPVSIQIWFAVARGARKHNDVNNSNNSNTYHLTRTRQNWRIFWEKPLKYQERKELLFVLLVILFFSFWRKGQMWISCIKCLFSLTGIKSFGLSTWIAPYASGTKQQSICQWKIDVAAARGCT